MSFAVFKEPEVRELVETFGSQRSLVVVIGAGASVEASLPTWEQFVERLLKVSAESTDAFDLSKEQLELWVARTIRSESLLGAAAIADALSGGRLDALIPKALFGDKSITSYQPGPTLNQLVHLRQAFGSHVSFITTNYDDLFEEALRKHRLSPQPFVKGGTPVRENTVPVFHPHGFLARRADSDTARMKGPFVVSEEHFQLVGQSFAHQQHAAVSGKLVENPCLFVGVSLTDPNLLRYIYRYTTGAHPHAAVFIRQAEYGVEPESADLPQPRRIGKAVQLAREQAICERWTRRNLRAVFLDHFSDLAYLIHEIAFYKERGQSMYEGLDVRTAKWIRAFQRVYAPKEPEPFLEAQVALNAILRDALSDAIATVQETMADRGEPLDLGYERLAAALWITTPNGKMLIDWATTDRLHRDPKTVTARKLDMGSRWISVKTVLHGQPHSATRNVYTSRWRYVLGLPLHIHTDDDDTLPVGCLTVTSTKPRGKTLLTSLQGDVAAVFNRTLRKTVSTSLKSTVPV